MRGPTIPRGRRRNHRCGADCGVSGGGPLAAFLPVVIIRGIVVDRIRVLFIGSGLLIERLDDLNAVYILHDCIVHITACNNRTLILFRIILCHAHRKDHADRNRNQ